MAKNKSSFVVENPQALTDVLDRAALGASESALRKGAAAGATVFYREIKVRAMPYYRTGTLEDAIIVTYIPEESVAGKLATYAVTFNKKAWYARLLEYGTSKMAARPFIRPSFDAKQNEAGAAVIEQVQEAINSGK
ncbi:HK97 gp10 family phage protein [Paraburkholderia fungorum]|uniref:HK97-gp10 family putative phage morphogenesis protein n=1 Tax=Paraburkholderia fungorum TaxID=134537 RepID=UPI0038BD86E8